MYSANKSIRNLIVIFLILGIIGIRASAASISIDAAIEKIEITKGKCLSIDKDCSYTDQNKIDLGKRPSSKLHLFYHLLGNLVYTQACCLIHNLSLTPPDYSKILILTLFPTVIFHPPRV